MKRLSLGALSALTLVTFAGSAVAQTTSPAVLNSLEVQQLIKRAEPADHARLQAHFSLLAEQYAADAKRHNAMGQAFIASPIRRTPANSAADHCKRLERLNLESAATLRELAVYHKGLAAGKVAEPPRGATPFEKGAGASTPTAEELTALAGKASTAADHHALHEYFQSLETRYTADAKAHAADALAYQGTRIAQAAAHCTRLVTLSKESAKEAGAAAAMHQKLAGEAR